ncbi:haloacid dehalogenase superfamily, subfamily IA, variant 3 with third motif having DD or ED/haloacid dehalogenase superfamily, subfamily IA, variant 1 with third motif having Dx(3-4)D or Dx(3-4)E [Filimonas lacunae]|uniref:Haloacid dehalogenase superfamily, subfamily IA, variant 3 with third motif having DD or ED/haloacid dehalogenase superfamily, subfamily IA, variant 1 with third motif having Dx(3-4)D or Dx(3-4)E n=1 Tax=Filimonas lacunae TaxID=477680 RepID=A0A173MRB6_9BACT|nr:HAD-IA family hydrolase [Filimonas lacunae]BAV09990.1 phosphatase YqaB [Filimonas lacunae]SIS82195.1 haloacid dehalogenase superfamily, subfamily IA, variant 3 with third motif having DD or ED/haloacid dehalogenase superfamily, subfamily IA, variant 1 with third motif having Dx(3-4)D or Dx(3-4)E [Filimonas lacunae]
MSNPGTIEQKLDKLTRLTEGYDAFLYDCDGTLADNMQAHKDSYVKVAKSYGLDMDAAIIDELAGYPTVLVVKEINNRYGTNFDPVEFATTKSRVFFEEYIEKTLPIDFVVAHLKAHHGKVKIGVVSGGSRRTVSKTLTVLGIFDLIEVMVCAGETPNGKPFPDPFLKAAEELGIAPERCIVFEDGEPGVQAATAAGMQSIRVDKIV